MKRTWTRSLIFSFLFSLSTIFNPAFSADFHSPRTGALGGAGHAGPLTNDAIYLNPSYASFVSAYSISGSYSTYRDTATEGRLLNVSVIDGRSPLFQAGVGYTVRSNDAWLHLGSSKAITERFSLGVGGKLILNQGKPDAKEGTISATVIPSPWLQLALIGDNLVGDKDAIEKYKLNREIILGTKWLAMGLLVGYADPVFVPQPRDGAGSFGFSAGAELTMFKDLFARAGFFKNSSVPYVSERGDGMGLGMGWMAPRLSLDYAFQRMLRSNSGLGTANSHVFGATIFF